MLERRGGWARGVTWVTRAVALLGRGEGPRMVADTLHGLRRHARTVGRVDGLRSRAQMLRLTAESLLGREIDQPPAATAVAVSARAVSPRPLWLRPRSRDQAAFAFLDGRHHLPPPESARPPARIAVFGANIGLVLAELATLHPGARLLGVEPDPDNATLARRNLAHLGARCEIAEKAVWWCDGRIEVAWGRDAWGLNLRGASPDQRSGSERSVEAVDAAVLIDRFTGGEPLDFLLVNVESSWYDLLRHGDWTRNVRCIKIEIQDHYDEAVPMLRALGYRARLECLPWGAFAVGVRPDAHRVGERSVGGVGGGGFSGTGAAAS